MSHPRAIRLLGSVVAGVSSAALLSLPIAPTGSAAPVSESQAASSTTRYDTSIRFLSFDSIRRYGTATRIRGQVVATTATGTGAVAGARVTVSRRLAGTTAWTKLGTSVTTNTKYPHFRFTAASVGNARYRVRFAGNSSLEPSRNQTSARVYRSITGRIEDGSGRFHGRVTPRYGKRWVRLEKRSCGTCGWHRVRTARAGPRGGYSFKVGAPRSGKWYFRVSTAATTRFIRSYSGVFTTRLR